MYFVNKLILFLAVFNFIHAFDDELFVQIKISMDTQFRSSDLPLPDRPISLIGLEKLKISASSQYNQADLEAFLKAYFDRNVTVVDLRRECHGFINGHIAAWKLRKPINYQEYEYNLDLTVHEIEAKELGFLKRLINNSAFECMIGTKPGMLISVEKIATEREIVERAGALYLRIPVLDHTKPEDEEVDQFVQFINSRKDNEWTHLHCAGGRGRTTVFSCMVDMIYNSSQLSAYEIIKRQEALGGSNLWDSEEVYKDEPWIVIQRGIDRCNFVCLFHQYCLENPDFKVKWSDWIKSVDNQAA